MVFGSYNAAELLESFESLYKPSGPGVLLVRSYKRGLSVGKLT